MKTYICLLRGINVSGKNIIKMDALKQMFESLGATNVKTYIQSGNVVFQYKDEKPVALETLITSRILADFGFDVPVQVLSSEKLKRIVENNPFLKDSSKDEAFLHLTFLSEPPQKIDQEILFSKKTGNEEIVITDAVAYLYCPHGYGGTKLNNNFLENKLKVQATTRNWKTTLKLLEMAAG